MSSSGGSSIVGWGMVTGVEINAGFSPSYMCLQRPVTCTLVTVLGEWSE